MRKTIPGSGHGPLGNAHARAESESNLPVDITPALGEPEGQPNRKRPHRRSAWSNCRNAGGEWEKNSVPHDTLGSTYTKPLQVEDVQTGTRKHIVQTTGCHAELIVGHVVSNAELE